MPTWNVKEGSPAYESAVRSLLLVLRRANGFVSANPQVRGLFDGQIGKKEREQEYTRRIYNRYNEN